MIATIDAEHGVDLHVAARSGMTVSSELSCAVSTPMRYAERPVRYRDPATVDMLGMMSKLVVTGKPNSCIERFARRARFDCAWI